MAETKAWWSPSSSPELGAKEEDLTIKPMSLEQLPQEKPEELLTRRIHILGMGSIGTLVTHSLRCLPNPPPISLLLHRPIAYEEFKKTNRIVRLVNKRTGINDGQTGFDVDVLEDKDGVPFWRYIPDTPDRDSQQHTNPRTEAEVMQSEETYINNLIVTVKGPATKTSLQNIKHRVDARTTILLLQNGMGQIDELNREVFTDPETRPTYMIGIISHGAYLEGRFKVVHAGPGTVALGIYRDTDRYPLPPRNHDTNISDMSESERKRYYPTDEELYSNLSSRYLLRTMTRSPVLCCAAFPYIDVLQLQLDKLAQNCIMNPLTALLDIKNGYMLDNDPWTRAQRLLLAEVSLVIRGLPELEGIPNVRARFSTSRLEDHVKDIATRTASNSSSMREDVRKELSTEIDYINGYIVRRGEEQGIKCVLNYMITQLIKGRYVCQKIRRDASVSEGVSSIDTLHQADVSENSTSGVVLEDKSSGKA